MIQVGSHTASEKKKNNLFVGGDDPTIYQLMTRRARDQYELQDDIDWIARVLRVRIQLLERGNLILEGQVRNRFEDRLEGMRNADLIIINIVSRMRARILDLENLVMQLFRAEE